MLAAFSADAVNPKLRFRRESFCTVSNIATGDLMEGLSSRESERWKHVRRTGLRSARAPLCTEVECLRPLLPDSPFRATIAESAQGERDARAGNVDVAVKFDCPQKPDPRGVPGNSLIGSRTSRRTRSCIHMIMFRKML